MVNKQIGLVRAAQSLMVNKHRSHIWNNVDKLRSQIDKTNACCGEEKLGASRVAEKK